MRVLVDALSVHFGGGLTFALEQLQALRRVRGDIDLEVLVAPWNRDSLGPSLQAAGASVDEVRLASLPQRWAWQETALPRRARGADVLYAPGNFLPLVPVGRPTVVCQQNPNYTAEARAMAHNRPPGRRLRIAQAYRSMRVASRVVVVAHWMLRSLVTEIPSLARRGVVIHSGVPGWPATARRPAGMGDTPSSWCCPTMHPTRTSTCSSKGGGGLPPTGQHRAIWSWPATWGLNGWPTTLVRFPPRWSPACTTWAR